ncbi:hypothetical protein B0H21DRAFT_825553 [Amylocystis lapponica]|nr:hypothetical protein B0H21DRAFT_825553 [Amylocystis lapponica]
MFGSFNTPIVNPPVQSTSQFAPGPFGQSFSTPTPHMSFAPQMHGASGMQQPSFRDASFMGMSEDTADRLAALQAKLNKKLGPEFISQRPGPGGGPKLTYAEGWRIINLANEVFGFNGWSSTVVSLTTDFIDQNEESKRFTVGVTAIIRITLRDGAFHEDIGYGMLENSKSKGAALDKCKKEAVTDGVKRALRNFGNLLGNCLYDKSYTQEVIKIKVPPSKLDRNDLHRRPELDETNSGMPTAGSSVKPEYPINAGHNQASTSAPQGQTASAGPSYMRSTMMSGTNQGSMAPPLAAYTPNAKGKQSMGSTGLQTPIRTPAGPQASARAGPSHGVQPARNPPPQLQNKPDPAFAPAPAAAPPPPAEVTAKKAPVEEEEEDMFSFYPEDDAFLAAVDLGEGDEGLGGPIDFDEGIGGVSTSVESDGSGVGRKADGNGARVDIEQHEGPPLPPPVQQPPSPEPAQKQQHSRHPQPPQARVPAPPQQSRAVQKKQVSGSESNENVPALQPHAGMSASTGTSARTGTPSQGGFHFPTTESAQSARAANAPSSSGIGQKRSADVMRGQSAAPVRRPGQGISMANPTPVGSVPVGGAGWPVPQLNAAKREPLSALEVDEGGDVKRVRR